MNEHIHLIGNAHLDPAWLWRLDEGFEAFLATCRSALSIMEETPGFIFTSSSAACYAFVEETDPKLFGKIQDAVREGRWEIVGGWWVEPDCNIPSGESFVRQALYGQRYFRSRFGKECTVGYCVDSFGHNANLPQLLSRAGMKAYVFMRPGHEELSLPAALFRWRSPNEDEVLAYRIPFHYSNFRHSISEKVELLTQSAAYRKEIPWMLFYGVGNHGGGPTRAQVAEIIRNGFTMSQTEKFFGQADKVSDQLPIYKGELQHHAIGCYSNHAVLKAANRKAEHGLLRAEKFVVLAKALTGFTSNNKEFDQAWKNVLLNQFHDTLGGVSTEEVCHDALDLYGESMAIAARSERIALQRIRNDIDTSNTLESLILFNPQLHPYSGPVEFELWNPEGSEKGLELNDITLSNSSGEIIKVQRIESNAKIGPDRVRFTAQCDISAFGWKRYLLSRSSTPQSPTTLRIDTTSMTNGKLTFAIKEDSNVLSYMPLEVFRDDSDTWAHGLTSFHNKIGEFTITNVEVIENGPIRAKMRITSQYEISKCIQDIMLYEGSDELIVETALDWRESHALCKMSFAHYLTDPQCFCEIPYAVIERDSDGKEYPIISWAFINDTQNGLGIITDSKSSLSCSGDKISFIVARSPLYAHHVPPHVLDNRQSMRYLDHGVQRFTTKVILGHPTFQSAAMAIRSLHFHEPPVAVIESSHPGSLSGEFSGGELHGKGICANVIKPAVDGNGVVIRFYETDGNEAIADIELPLFRVRSNVALRPYEIKTYGIKDANTSEMNLLEDNL